MDDYLSISTINDFIFCPYSIYLHNVYMESDEELFHATPQVKGKVSHTSIDNKTYSTRKTDIMSIPVYSNQLGITGKIDLYKSDKKLLIERKYRLKQIFRGQIYQLWAQYFCLIEMGYKVENLAFYEISTNKMIPVELPDRKGFEELRTLIKQFRNFSPDMPFPINENKCTHCIYCSLCDKTNTDNVYT